MSRRAFLLAVAAAPIAGCVSVSVGTADTPGMTYYVLADARPAAPSASAARGPARLAIQAVGGDPMADSISLAYSRRPGERALYQFASWTERPSRRFAQRSQRRREAGGRFAAVTMLGQPVASDWLLTLALDTLVHDVAVTPGRAQVVLRAELIRRADRTRVAQRTFSAAPPVADAAAPAAVAAFAVAVADVLDPLTAWVESTVTADPGR